jgi:glycine hydroxymethyltransferase
MKLMELIRKNDEVRSNCLNLIASENILSHQVKKALSVQHGRYHAGFYGGSSVFRKIYHRSQELASEIFRCQSALISPLSGNMAFIAVLLAHSRPEDKIATLPLDPAGGYPINLEFFGRKRIDIPWDPIEFNIDLSQTIDILEKEEPPLVFLGSSLFLFPHPIKPITDLVKGYGGVVAYDGSQVMGLIAGNQFQDPLKEGVDILLGSTHKSFPGPQGGIILANDFSLDSLDDVVGLDPLKGIVLVDNIHNSRIAALGVALEEFQEFGHQYAKQTVLNAKSLAKTLDKHEILLHGKKRGFTESHQVLMQIKDFTQGAWYRDFLLQYKLVTDAAMRFGTAELTRQGFKNQEMELIGRIISELVHHVSMHRELTEFKQIEIKDTITKLIQRL